MEIYRTRANFQIKLTGYKNMKLNKAMLLVIATLFISGCGDQWWCGEDGCNAASSKTMVKSAE
ncbi:MAG: hypothetical protein BVN35_02420 [Proteobacteria bacterium ST_bin11]|nr:MAG: hypothetical protein BVN35_02420 [Proteobacteria bacterium ST_bin11]